MFARNSVILLFFCFTIASAQNKQVLLVLNKNENTLTFMDPMGLKAIKTIATGEGPHEICVSDDGKRAFIANYGHQQPGNSISIVDVEQQKEIKRVDLGALLRPHGMVYRDGRLYVTAEGSRAVFRYDTATDKIDWITSTGKSISHMLALSPDSKKVYTADIFSNTVTVISVDAPPLPQFIKHVDVGPKPEAIEITPDGTEVWVGHNDDGKITIINTAINEVDTQVAAGKMPIRIKFTSDGKYALVPDPPAGELVVLDAKNKTVIKRIPLAGGPVGIIITPDNKHAYVALTQLNMVCKIDLATLTETGRGKTGLNPDGIALSIIKG